MEAHQPHVDDATLAIVRTHVRKVGKNGVANKITAYFAGEQDELSAQTLLHCRNAVRQTTDKDGLRESLTNAFHEA